MSEHIGRLHAALDQTITNRRGVMSQSTRPLIPIDQAEHDALKARVAALEKWINAFMEFSKIWGPDHALRQMAVYGSPPFPAKSQDHPDAG